MAVFYGNIGFIGGESVEIEPGVWEELNTVRFYTGTILKQSKSWEVANSTNDNLNINAQVSIVADPFMFANLNAITYVELFGSKWKVKSFSIDSPRVTITLGGVYNG